MYKLERKKMKMSDITYSITEHIAKIASRGEWTLELNKVSFNDKPAKWDIRSWNEDHSRMSKGLSLSDEEFTELKLILSTL